MKSFEEVILNPNIKKAIDEMGFKNLTPVQQQAIPILLDQPTDFIGLAATGTGKTAAFAIPLLNKVEPGIRGVQGLVMCPTRELAMQVSQQIDLMGKYIGVRSVTIYGGASYRDQISGLKSGSSIVVGTPGRIVDLITRGALNLKTVKVTVLDEADEMISMGFKEDMETILGSISREESNIWLFSATMDSQVYRVADKFLRQPKEVQINRKEVLSQTVEQVYYATRESNKAEVLCKIIDAAEHFYGIVFCQTKALVVDLVQYLTEKGYKVDCLHGDKDQRSREMTIKNFRDKRVSILICTDVASRGLDVKDVTHVVNYSLPRELDSYVHRIGRTARGGKKGIAMSLVTPSHRHLIERLERLTKSKIKEGILPTRKDIGSKKVSALLGNFKSRQNYQRAQALLGPDWVKTLEGMSATEVASRFLAMNFPDLFEDVAKEKVTFGGPERFDAAHKRREKSDDNRDRERTNPWMKGRRNNSRDGGGHRKGKGFRGHQ